MFDPKKKARPNILKMTPYKSARDAFAGEVGISLDANENPFGTIHNRYPDVNHSALKKAFATTYDLASESLIFGNGSDEIIGLIISAFCEPGRDKILIFPPTFSMYQVCATINNNEILAQPLVENQLDIPNILPKLSIPNLKVVFICSPNNPTGNKMNREDILTIINHFDGLVVVDEAYSDFSGESLIHDDFPNVLVLQTFSKAKALAAIRLGVGIASPEIIRILHKIKPPYNISEHTQKEALNVLKRLEQVSKEVEILISERKKMVQSLEKLSCVKKVYPSDANFLLVEFGDAKKIYNLLLSNGIVVRDQSHVISNTLRITVGKPEENLMVLSTLA